MFVQAYLQMAESVIQAYSLPQPLHLFLKTFLKNNRQLGSRDRRYVRELVFGFYRLGPQPEMSVRDACLTGAFLSGRLPQLFFVKCGFNGSELSELDLLEKWKWIQTQQKMSWNLSYPYSEKITNAYYLTYLFSPKKVFIRIRNPRIKELLLRAEVEFKEETKNCISFSQHIDMEELGMPPEDYVVQDISSQQVQAFLNPKPEEKWWDCCAASGGKSLLLLDQKVPVHLTVSDIRPQILGNLQLRLKRYGFQIQESIELDLTEKIPTKMNEQFDQIICDVPCSGSGTWSHSPEQFYFFDAKQLKNYVQRQALILRHVWKALKPGGKLIYLTCSILSAENEMQIAQFRQEYECELEQQKVLFHQPYGGDGMYIAVLRKPDQEVLI